MLAHCFIFEINKTKASALIYVGKFHFAVFLKVFRYVPFVQGVLNAMDEQLMLMLSNLNLETTKINRRLYYKHNFKMNLVGMERYTMVLNCRLPII